MRRPRVRQVTGSLLLLAAVAALTAPRWFEWNWLRRPVSHFASQALDREVQIDGPLDVDLGRTMVVTVEGLRVANADWGTDAPLLDGGRIEVGIRLMSLFRPGQDFSIWKLEGTRLHLERDASGKANWSFAGDAPEGRAEDRTDPWSRTRLPTVAQVALHDVQLHLDDRAGGRQLRLQLADVVGGGGRDQPFRLQGTGDFQGEPMRLDLDGDDFDTLRDDAAPYPVKLAIKLGSTEATVAGALEQPKPGETFALDMSINGPNLAVLYDATGVPLPATPPYRLKGRLVRAPDRWKFARFSGAVGDSDLSGDLVVRLGGPRMKLEAQLVSSNLDFDDLAPLVGAPPDASESASTEQVQEAAEYEADPRAIPDQALPLAKLRIADADVVLQAEHIEAPGLPLDDMQLELKLENGRLQLKPLAFGLAQGRLATYATIEAGDAPVHWNVEARARELHLKSLFGDSGPAELSEGTIEGDIRLKTRGNNLREAAAASDGEIALQIAGGQVSGLLLELVGLDAAEALGFLATKDKPATIRCMRGRFSVTQGVVKSDELVFDTSDTRVDAELEADLETERFELELHPRPKDPSLFSARTPITAKGTFKDIGVAPDYGKLGLRFGAAAALGTALTPLAALVAFIEPGLAESADCAGLEGEAEEREAAPEQAED